jgi:hypothetical protein
MFVTFIYRICGNPTTCYGKFLSGWISDDHQGLDAEMKSVLVNAINRRRRRDVLQGSLLREEEVTLGILSVSYAESFPIYSTSEERFCFDFYYTDYGYSSDACQAYLDGVLIP